MPTLDLTDEELRGLAQLAITGSGPGINWALTNAILVKVQKAQEALLPQPTISKTNSDKRHERRLPDQP
jgi:hypothetical protein